MEQKMAKIKAPEVKIPILLPLTLAISILLLVSVGGIYWLQQHNIDKHVQSRLDTIRQMFKNQIDHDAEIMTGLLHFLTEDPALEKAWLAEDREQLLSLAAPIFKDIGDIHHVTHFYFHRPDRTCFLRVHNPPRYGDYIDRFTMDAAVREQQIAYGIELGPFGTFTLRVVQPWRIDGTLVGYLELGEEIEHMTAELKKTGGVELFFTINKSYLDRTKWEEGMKMIGHAGDWDTFEHFAIINQTLPTLPPKLARYLKTLSRCDDDEHLGSVIRMFSEDHYYQATFLPLIDAGERDVGDIIVLTDITAEHAALRTLSALMILIGAVIGMSLVGLFYMYVKRIEQRLGRAYHALETEVEEREQAEQKVERQNRFLNNIFECLTYPFYVVDADDYTIKMANTAANTGDLSPKPTCYMIFHKRTKACDGIDEPCPLEEAKKTRKPVTVEHVHYDKNGNPVYAEVHAYPIIDSDEVVHEVIEYCLNITDRKTSEERLRKNITELERFNRLAVGRELQMIELKKEINTLLAELGREERYRTDHHRAEKSSGASTI